MTLAGKSRVLQFLESDPPWWWQTILPPLAFVGLIWWVGPLTVVTFIVQAMLVVLFICIPIYLFVRLVTGGR